MLGEEIMVPVLLTLMEDTFLLFIAPIMAEDLIKGHLQYLVVTLAEVLVITEMSRAPPMDLCLLLPKRQEDADGSTQPLWRIRQQNSYRGCFSCSVVLSSFACFCSEREESEMKRLDFIYCTFES